MRKSILLETCSRRGVILCVSLVLLLVNINVGHAQLTSSSTASPTMTGDTAVPAANRRIIIINKEITLPCNGSEDASSVTWLKNGVAVNFNERVTKREDNTLVITKALVEDVGKYTCRIEGPSTSEFTYEIMTKAYVDKLPKSVNLVEEDTLTLHCHVRGSPTPTVEWFKNDIDVAQTQNSSRIILSADKNNVADAILTIKNVQNPFDRGVYKCVAKNANNNDTTQVIVRVKDKLAALWPFLGIVVEVIILCTIIFIYEKRRGKMESEESDTDQGSDTKIAADNNKSGDVRQRK